MHLVFDIECDALLDSLTTVWCIGVLNVRTGEKNLYRADQIAAALEHMSKAEVLYGHNIIGFDLPALRKVYGWVPDEKCVVRDTMLWSMLLFPDMRGKGKAKKSDDDDDVEEVILGHSLSSWGKRLGCLKSEYEGTWDQPTEEMYEYCSQDVLVTEHLRRHLVSLNRTSESALVLEHQFAQIVQRMEERGIKFDVEGAEALYTKLQTEQAELETDISKDIPPTVTDMKTPEYWVATWSDGTAENFATKGIADTTRKARKIKPKDCTISPGPLRKSVEPFNPNSRPQVRKYLFDKYGWLSPKLTESGEKLLELHDSVTLAKDYGSLSEDILRNCPFPEGHKFADYLLITKVCGFLKGRDDTKGWLALSKNGRIHHRMLTIGCVTGRCAHSGPNLGQVVGVSLGKDKKPLLGLQGRYGWECRSLFSADRIQVGTDMSAVESIALGHYLAPYDKGAYIQQVLHGDIHQQNVNALIKYAGYTVGRNPSKNITYAWAYGAANLKLGSMIIHISPEAMLEYENLRDYYRSHNGAIKSSVWSAALESRRKATPEEAAFIEIGAKVRNAYEQGITGLSDLLAKLKEACKKGYITIQDGRHIPVRSAHAALNCLLQGSCAVLMKKWVCLTYEYNLRDGVDWFPLCIIHDELQADVHPDHVVKYKENCLKAIADAGAAYGWRCQLSGESKVGNNWAVCH